MHRILDSGKITCRRFGESRESRVESAHLPEVIPISEIAQRGMVRDKNSAFRREVTEFPPNPSICSQQEGSEALSTVNIGDGIRWIS
jgi:hypothetical protein